MSSRISLNLTGFDTDSVIKNLMALESQPLLKLKDRQTALLTRKTAWNAVKSQADILSSKIASLVSSTSFAAKAATVNNTSVLSATALATAVEGTYQIQVNSLAAAQVAQSAAFSSTNTALNLSGIVSLNGKSITVDATDSLETVTAKINATIGVNASAAIVQTEPGKYSMVLTSAQTGVSGAMQFGGDLATWRGLGVLDASNAVNQVTAARDAAFTVNGILFTRASNTVTDVIPNVTLNLLQAVDLAGNGGKATLTVGYDDDAMVSNVKAFVTEYNNLIDTVSKYNTWNATTRVAGPLFGDSLATGLLSEMRSAVFAGVPGSTATYDSLMTIGITSGTGTSYSKEGRLTLDETKLRAALKADRNAISVLFGASAANVALASSGSTVSATSTIDPVAFPVASVIDGSTSSTLWGSGGGWNDGTVADFTNDRLEVSFGQSRTIDKVSVYTLDSATFPASSYGIRDFNLEYWTGTAWAALGTAVTGNTSGSQTLTFPAVTTTKIRLNVTGANDGQYSRVVELQAFQQNCGAFTRLNSALNRYVSSSGFLINRNKALDDENTALQRSIDDMQKRLDAKEASLRKQYTALEVTLQKLNSQSAWLTQTIQSMSTIR